jgi:hypothetical protein
MGSPKNKRCGHGRRRSRCKECGGSEICSHGRQQRSQCKECKGGSICEHNRIRSTCKQCKGGGICPHNRVRSKCKECKGVRFVPTIGYVAIAKIAEAVRFVLMTTNAPLALGANRKMFSKYIKGRHKKGIFRSNLHSKNSSGLFHLHAFSVVRTKNQCRVTGSIAAKVTCSGTANPSATYATQ